MKPRTYSNRATCYTSCKKCDFLKALDPRPLENVGHDPFVYFIGFSFHVSLSTCSKKINARYRNITDISLVIRVRYLKRCSVSLAVLDKSVHLLWSLLKMRNELCLDRVSGFAKSIFLGCILLSLAIRISADDDKETFESKYRLDESKSLDNSEPFHEEIYPKVGDAVTKNTPEELEDLTDDGNTNREIDEGNGDEVPNVSDVVEPKEQITFSEGISGRPIGQKSGKYVRYGECSDIDGRDHYFVHFVSSVEISKFVVSRLIQPDFSFFFLCRSNRRACSFPESLFLESVSC